MENHYKEMKKKYGYAYETPEEREKGRKLRSGKKPTEEEQAMVEWLLELTKLTIKCPNCNWITKEKVKICENCGKSFP